MQLTRKLIFSPQLLLVLCGLLFLAQALWQWHLHSLNNVSVDFLLLNFAAFAILTFAAARSVFQPRSQTQQNFAVSKSESWACGLSPHGLLIVDEQKNLLWCNPRANEILGSNNRALETLVGQGEAAWSECLETNAKNALETCISSAFSSTADSVEKIFSIALPSRKNETNASILWFQVQGTALKQRGKQRLKFPQAVLLTMQNITHWKEQEAQLQKQLQEQVKTREEAETILRMRSEFIGMISHELRTPLQAISGWASLLHSGNLSEEKRKRAIVRIEQNARSESYLVDTLFEVSSLSDASPKYNREKLNIRRVLENALQASGPLVISKHQILKLNLTSMDYFVIGDEKKLLHVFWFLLSHASKQSDHEGKISVLLERREDFITFEVQDNGIGIAPDQVHKIFESTIAENTGISRIYSGLGIGLTLAKQFVFGHAGTIKVNSLGIGHGTTFTVNLPVLPS